MIALSPCALTTVSVTYKTYTVQTWVLGVYHAICPAFPPSYHPHSPCHPHSPPLTNLTHSHPHPHTVTLPLAPWLLTLSIALTLPLSQSLTHTLSPRYVATYIRSHPTAIHPFIHVPPTQLKEARCSHKQGNKHPRNAYFVWVH